jgi:hypothetical protein
MGIPASSWVPPSDGNDRSLIMAKAESSNLEIDWLERDRRVITSLDRLGVQAVSISLYAFLLPGITNVTDRASPGQMAMLDEARRGGATVSLHDSTNTAE